MKKGFWILGLVGVSLLAAAGVWGYRYMQRNPGVSVGKPVDSLNGVVVYYNGSVGNVSGRNTTADGYNLGLRYQCVEFVKRYYYEHLGHKMPDAYGHAKDFFDKSVTDGALNPKRALLQFTNPSASRPQPDDLLIFKGHLLNRYGHVAIVSKVADDKIQIIQQNPGPGGTSRETIPLLQKEGKWQLEHGRIVGWLRKGA